MERRQVQQGHHPGPFSLQGRPSGIYLLRVVQDGVMQVERLIKH